MKTESTVDSKYTNFPSKQSASIGQHVFITLLSESFLFFFFGLLFQLLIAIFVHKLLGDSFLILRKQIGCSYTEINQNINITSSFSFKTKNTFKVGTMTLSHLL